MDIRDWNRLALITALAEKMKDRPGEFGRTALMKFAYLLQVIKDVPLGNRFTLYAYGPFDPPVLSDLSYASTLKAVTESTVNRGSSYGYDIKPGEAADVIKERAQQFLEEYSADIDWVVAEFGGNNAGELELISTIVYADREGERDGKPCKARELSEVVNKIKPHFSVELIEVKTAGLRQKGLLRAVVD